MPLLCGACKKWFEPKDGTVDVFRETWDSAGVEVCKECINRLTSHNVIKRDESTLKCRCESLEYDRCEVHDGLVKPVVMN